MNIESNNIKNYYEETRRRLTFFNTNYNNISDREIIENLAKEIEQYRNRIEQQNKIIKQLSEQTIKSKEEILDTTDELIDDDIAEIITETEYADGKPIKIITEYKYK